MSKEHPEPVEADRLELVSEPARPIPSLQVDAALIVDQVRASDPSSPETFGLYRDKD